MTFISILVMIMRMIRAMIGVALLLCCVATGRTLLFVISSLGASFERMPPMPVLVIGLGFLAWLIIFSFLPRPVRLYVLAHEISHALWGTAMGARVFGIRVAKNGGHVKLSGHNFLVALAPYFFPFYTIVLMIVYYLLSVWWDMRVFHLPWLALIGLSLGFHFSFTIQALSRKQSDVREYGRVFSYALICFLCMLEITIAIAIVSPSMSVGVFIRRFASDVAEVWMWVWFVLCDLVRLCAGYSCLVW